MIGIAIVIIAILIVWVGSRRNLLLAIISTISFSIAVQWLTVEVCMWLTITRYAWQVPICLLLSLGAMALSITYVWHEDLLFVTPEWVTERRRSTSVKAELRRKLKSYKVEVSS